MTTQAVEDELRGELRDELTRALRRLPELGTGELTFTAFDRLLTVAGRPTFERALTDAAGG
jgi:hypothetical protein